MSTEVCRRGHVTFQQQSSKQEFVVPWSNPSQLRTMACPRRRTSAGMAPNCVWVLSTWRGYGVVQPPHLGPLLQIVHGNAFPFRMSPPRTIRGRGSIQGHPVRPRNYPVVGLNYLDLGGFAEVVSKPDCTPTNDLSRHLLAKPVYESSTDVQCTCPATSFRFIDAASVLRDKLG